MPSLQTKCVSSDCSRERGDCVLRNLSCNPSSRPGAKRASGQASNTHTRRPLGERRISLVLLSLQRTRLSLLTFSCDLDTLPLFSASKAVKAYQMDFKSSARSSMIRGRRAPAGASTGGSFLGRPPAAPRDSRREPPAATAQPLARSLSRQPSVLLRDR